MRVFLLTILVCETVALTASTRGPKPRELSSPSTVEVAKKNAGKLVPQLLGLHKYVRREAFKYINAPLLNLLEGCYNYNAQKMTFEDFATLSDVEVNGNVKVLKLMDSKGEKGYCVTLESYFELFFNRNEKFFIQNPFNREKIPVILDELNQLISWHKDFEMVVATMDAEGHVDAIESRVHSDADEHAYLIWDSAHRGNLTRMQQILSVVREHSQDLLVKTIRDAVVDQPLTFELAEEGSADGLRLVFEAIPDDVREKTLEKILFREFDERTILQVAAEHGSEVVVAVLDTAEKAGLLADVLLGRPRRPGCSGLLEAIKKEDHAAAMAILTRAKALGVAAELLAGRDGEAILSSASDELKSALLAVKNNADSNSSSE